jgi:hypothetical protein
MFPIVKISEPSDPRTYPSTVPVRRAPPSSWPSRWNVRSALNTPVTRQISLIPTWATVPLRVLSGATSTVWFKSGQPLVAGEIVHGTVPSEGGNGAAAWAGDAIHTVPEINAAAITALCFLKITLSVLTVTLTHPRGTRLGYCVRKGYGNSPKWGNGCRNSRGLKRRFLSPYYISR